MKIRNIIKIILVICIITFISMNVSNAEVQTQITDGGGSRTSNSDSSQLGTFSDWQQQADDFLNKGAQGSTIDTQTAIEAFLPIGRVLVGIATVILVIVGSIIGVKYMIAGADEKAKLKEKLIYYVISIVLVYGAVGIFTLVVNIMNGILA